MNRIAIGDLSSVRTLARQDLAGTVGGFLLPGGIGNSIQKMKAKRYLECLKRAKTPFRKRLCRANLD